MAESECRQSNENPSEPLPVPLPPDQLNATKRKINEDACGSSLSSTSTGTLSTISQFFNAKSSVAAKKTLSMLTPNCLKPKKNQNQCKKVGKKKYQRIMGFSDDHDSPSPDEHESVNDVDVNTLGQVIRVGEAIQQGTRRKNTKSKVWKYFEAPENGLAKCKLCVNKFYKTGGGTSNLRDHLSRAHQTAFIEVENDEDGSVDEPVREFKKKMLKESLQKILPYSASSDKHKRINRKLAMMIARDFQPTSIVQNAGFRDLVQELNPRYKMICRKTLMTQVLPECFGIAVDHLNNLLSKATSVSITTDVWTSTARDSYLGITCHFIHQNEKGFHLISAALDTVPLKKNETADTIKRVLEAVFSEWSIRDKVKCIVTDNAAAMKKAVDLLKIRHLPCFAHSLNLVIKNAVLCIMKEDGKFNTPDENDEQAVTEMMNDNSDDIRKIINDCKRLVSFFHKSPKATRLLREARKKARMEDGEISGELVSHIEVRWNTLLHMLDSVVDNLDFIKQVITQEEYDIYVPKKEEVVILKEILSVLRPFEAATKKVSGEKYVTLSSVIPCIKGIEKKLTQVGLELKTPQAGIFLQRINYFFRQKLYHFEERTPCRFATLLDPRYKEKGFREAGNAQLSIKSLKSTLAEQLKLKAQEADSPALQKVSTQPRPAAQDDILNFLSDDDETGLQNWTVEGIILGDTYVKAERLKCTEDGQTPDPLQYWFEKRDIFSEFLPLIFEYFCIPGSSVPCERMFSRSGYIVTERRNRLKPTNVQILTFLNMNYDFVLDDTGDVPV